MKKLLLLFGVWAALSGILYTVASEPFDGKWYTSGILEDNNEYNFGWYIEYTFDHHMYSMKGYPPIARQGTYKVLSQEGETYKIEITYRDSDTNEERIDTMVLSYNGETITINGTEFTRQN